MAHSIVFCDIDGTLLDSRLQMLPGTLSAIRALEDRQVPFVIVSGRAPAGIRPLMARYALSCPMIAFGGGLALDESGRVLLEHSLSRETALAVVRRIEAEGDACCWNLYAGDLWLVRDRRDARVANEEYEVQTPSAEGDPRALPPGTRVHKLMGICRPGAIGRVTALLREAFPRLSVVPSSDILIEIMPGGVDKGQAVRAYCHALGLSPENAVAFGDNFNDTAMLDAVGTPVVMGNAPASLRAQFPEHITLDNDHGGIAQALRRLGLTEADPGTRPRGEPEATA